MSIYTCLYNKTLNWHFGKFIFFTLNQKTFRRLMMEIVTDASDFKDTCIPNLSQLDSLLRCHICKDFLKVPVLTPCGHTFCSICIREYISQSSKCPLCLKELRDSMLRSEFLVNEVTECYKSLRQPLLNNLVVEKIKDKSQKIIAKINQNDDDGNDDSDLIMTTATSSNKQTADNSFIQLDSEPDSSLIITKDDDIQILSTSSLIEPRKINTLSNNSKKRSRSTVESMFSNNKSNQKMAQCPICSEFFPIKTLERTHLDECLNLQSLGKVPTLNKNKKAKLPSSRSSVVLKRKPVTERQNTLRNQSPALRSTSSPTPTPTPEVSHVSKYLKSTNNQNENRLPKLDHSSLTLSQLKSKLSSLGLNTNGTRQNIIDRYNHYELIWNSNFVDSMNPVDEKELKRQLHSWEKSHLATSANNTTIGKMLNKKKNQISNSYIQLMENFKNDRFNRMGWCNLFRKDFKKLIKEAKSNSRKINKEIPNESDEKVEQANKITKDVENISKEDEDHEKEEVPGSLNENDSDGDEDIEKLLNSDILEDLEQEAKKQDTPEKKADEHEKEQINDNS